MTSVATWDPASPLGVVRLDAFVLLGQKVANSDAYEQTAAQANTALDRDGKAFDAFVKPAQASDASLIKTHGLAAKTVTRMQ